MMIFGSVLLCAVSIGGFVFRDQPPPPPPLWSNPPIYPDAQNLAHDPWALMNQSGSMLANPKHVITFTTSASVDQVSHFYETSYAQSGWHFYAAPRQNDKIMLNMFYNMDYGYGLPAERLALTGFMLYVSLTNLGGSTAVEIYERIEGYLSQY